MKELIYTDPHHGLVLNSHTSPASRKRLQRAISTHLRGILETYRKERFVICGGDFFHSFRNPEEVVLDSVPSFWLTDILLEGNHDVSTVKDVKSSTDVLSFMDELCSVGSPRIVGSLYDAPAFRKVERGEKVYYFVPHHITQNSFDQALLSASESANKDNGRIRILVTHCNYDNPFATDGNSLNLHKSAAIKLLEVFDTIILGHEHNFRTDLDDRLIVLGCPHPTNFGDISEKFILLVEDNGDMELIPVWKPEGAFLSVDWKEAADARSDSIEFIKLTGEALPSEVPELARTIRKLWTGSDAYAIKSEVKIISPTKLSDGVSRDSAMFHVKQIVENELKGTDLYSLWEEIQRD